MGQSRKLVPFPRVAKMPYTPSTRKMGNSQVTPQKLWLCVIEVQSLSQAELSQLPWDGPHTRAPLCHQPQFPQTRTVCMCFKSLAETTERNGSLRIRSAMRLGGGTPCSPRVSRARTGPPVATSSQGLHTNGPRTHVHAKHGLQSPQIMCCTHAHSDANEWRCC